MLLEWAYMTARQADWQRGIGSVCGERCSAESGLGHVVAKALKTNLCLASCQQRINPKRERERRRDYPKLSLC